MMSSSPIFSVVVPNWNGEEFLSRGLSSLALSAERADSPYEIIVVDDASTDGSVALIQRDFPNVRLIRNERNLGFGRTANAGVEAAQASLVALVNNDLVAKPQFIPELLVSFDEDRDETLFAVTGKTLEWSGEEPNHLSMTAVFRRGEFQLRYSDPDSPTLTLFAQGGSIMFRRDRFLSLGGFCELFHPGYWEDYDLCYWAAKRGWRVIYNPRALALHFGKASLTKLLGPDGVVSLDERNRLLFTWLNLTDKKYLWEHFAGLPARCSREMWRGAGWGALRAVLDALPKIPRVMRQRAVRRPTLRRTDREVLSPFRRIGTPVRATE